MRKREREREQYNLHMWYFWNVQCISQQLSWMRKDNSQTDRTSSAFAACSQSRMCTQQCEMPDIPLASGHISGLKSMYVWHRKTGPRRQTKTCDCNKPMMFSAKSPGTQPIYEYFTSRCTHEHTILTQESCRECCVDCRKCSAAKRVFTKLPGKTPLPLLHLCFLLHFPFPTHFLFSLYHAFVLCSLTFSSAPSLLKLIRSRHIAAVWQYSQ